jgi:hypothetical protein
MSTHQHTGRDLAEKGMQLALSGLHHWQSDARAALGRYLHEHLERHGAGYEFPMEHFRLWWQHQDDWREPRSHNTWGAFTRSAALDGAIKATGRYTRAHSPATRAHPVMVWRASSRAFWVSA